MIVYRKAKPEDIYPAFKLALRVFVENEAPDHEQDAVDKFRSECINNEEYINNYAAGKHVMYIALENDNIVGLVNESGNGHISMLFVDGLYQRQNIAAALMNSIVCDLKLRGFNKITLNSSPYALQFYKYYGFKPAGAGQKKDGFIFTPMSYEPNEIWDVYDSSRSKTGRYTERGRKMAAGDYHLVVHVWKHNGKGEWLIDKRATGRGTSIDGKWETTGGSALAGDDSLTAALRESKEELGIDLDPQKGVLFHTAVRRGNDGQSCLQDVWVFEHSCPIEDVRFQEGETCDAMWASADKIREMMAAGEFVSERFYPYFNEMARRWG